MVLCDVGVLQFQNCHVKECFSSKTLVLCQHVYVCVMSACICLYYVNMLLFVLYQYVIVCVMSACTCLCYVSMLLFVLCQHVIVCVMPACICLCYVSMYMFVLWQYVYVCVVSAKLSCVMLVCYSSKIEFCDDVLQFYNCSVTVCYNSITVL